MKAAKPSRSGQSKATYRPKSPKFDNRKLNPASQTWDSLLNSLEKFSADFMADRDSVVHGM
jgi:virulence-associated protein VagC